MHFNVSQLLKEPCGASRSYRISDFAALQLGAPRVAVTGYLSMMRTDAGVWVSASLASYLDCLCSRCADDMEQPVSVRIEEEYLPEIDIATGARIHIPAPHDEQFYIDHAHMLDLSEAIRQYFTVSAPLKPVCNPACKGLCPDCGANLNQTRCDCAQTYTDPRWSALLDLAIARQPNPN